MQKNKKPRQIRITVMKMACHQDLIDRYENPLPQPCTMKLGQVFVTEGWDRPKGFCTSAWDSISPFVMVLAHGGQNIYDGWMKNPRSAMISCNDGFRPVTFLLETLEEDSGEQETGMAPPNETPALPGIRNDDVSS